MTTNVRYAFLLACLLCARRIFAEDATPLAQLHAHNDYEHAHPLFDALDHGFCSVEADIHLVGGKLLVAHKREEVNSQRTLQALYLDPLRERVKKNGGRVYPRGPEFTLLIDLKSDWRRIYPALRGVLTNYADILATFHDGIKQANAVTVVVTGNRTNTLFAGETLRYAALDGELSDLDSNPPTSLVPWISASWEKNFTWRGEGALPDADAQSLKAIVSRAHAQGRRVRFWGAPDTPDFWRTLLQFKVDLINTDDLAGAEKFLKETRVP